MSKSAEPVVEILKARGPRRAVERAAPPKVEKKEVVVRIAQGMRRPKKPAHTETMVISEATVFRTPTPDPAKDEARKVGPVVELNPRLARSRPIGAPAAAVPESSNKPPMSVAMKHRAAAEAVFSRLTAEAPASEATSTDPSASATTEAAAEPPLPFAARSAEEGGGSYSMRVSERDVLMTQLRLGTEPQEIARAALALVERFSLPPDQAVLVKVLGVGDETLTRVALEELLELQDRGRVRATPELLEVLDRTRARGGDVADLKTLLLEKLGVRGSSMEPRGRG